tara:strand:- start:153780 stop:154457 length:678 start_codon:yes stop_codon:yes gene_type:complete
MYNANLICDEERQARRAELRRKLAEAKLAQEKISDIRAVISELDALDDAAEEKHRSVTEPLQAELTALDAERTSAITRGDESGTEASQRRREIMRLISAANLELERSIAEQKTQRKPLEQQIELLAPSVPTQHIINEIANLGDPDLLARQWALSQRANRIGAAQKHNQAKIDEIDEAISVARPGDDKRLLQRRRERWMAEASLLAEERSDTAAQQNAIRDRLLND